METKTTERKSERQILGLSKSTSHELWAIIGDINEMLKEVGINGILVKHQERSDKDIISVSNFPWGESQ